MSAKQNIMRYTVPTSKDTIVRVKKMPHMCEALTE